jgi:hypothetical protein
MRIDSSGNVGIGETLPLGKLHVKTADSGATVDASADDLVIEGSGHTGISILSGASSNGSIYFGDAGVNYDGFVTYQQGTRSMGFGTAAGTRMTIDSSGNLLVGTTVSPSGQSGAIVQKMNGHSKASLTYGLNAAGNGSTTVTLDLMTVLGIQNLTTCSIEITAGGYGNSQSGNFAFKGLRVGYTNGAQYQSLHTMINSVTNGSISIGSGANTITITLNNTNSIGKNGTVHFDVTW